MRKFATSLINTYTDEKFATLIKESSSYRHSMETMGYKGNSPKVRKQFQQRVERLNLNTDHFTLGARPTDKSHYISRIERKRFILSKIGSECRTCGYKTNLAALCFHHEDEDSKEAGPATLVAKRSPLSNDEWWSIYRHEFEKCVTLCSNCHISYHNPEYELEAIKVSNSL